MNKNTINNVQFFKDISLISTIIFALFLRFIIISIFFGHSDPDGAAAYIENLNNYQDPLGMPYSLFSHIFPYYFADLFKTINVDYHKGLRILTVLSEIFLIYSINRLKLINPKYLIYFISLNPILIFYSGLHGATDLWSISFVFLAISEFKNKKILHCSFLFSIACLIKPMVVVSILFFISKDFKDNFKFFLIFIITCIIPYMLTFSFYMILKNLLLIFNYMILSSKSSTHIMWFLSDFTNKYSLFLIIISIIILIKYIPSKFDQFVLILPIVLLLKGGLAGQYFSWIVPLLIFNSKLGIISSFVFAINYSLSFYHSYFTEGIFTNIRAFTLNNRFFGDNVVIIPFNAEVFNYLNISISNISMFLILTNIIYFIIKRKNV